MPSGVYVRVKENRGCFKKGIIPWNKGIKINRKKYPNIGHLIPHSYKTRKKMSKNHSKCWLGRKHSEETKNKLRGENSVFWKGEDAGYGAMHDWVRKEKGVPQKCDLCGTIEKRRYHWANKNHKYRRILSDYFRACVPCHKKYDKKNNR